MLLCRTKTDIAWPYFFPLLVPKFPQTTTPQAEEEHKILENYLMEMRIEDGQLKFPPISELPDGFDLFFQRRSLRKTYEYEDDGDVFALNVCKDQSKEMNADQTDAYSFNESEEKVLLIIQKQHLYAFPWFKSVLTIRCNSSRISFFLCSLTGGSVSSVSACLFCPTVNETWYMKLKLHNYGSDTLNLTIFWSIWRYICRIERLLLHRFA